MFIKSLIIGTAALWATVATAAAQSSPHFTNKNVCEPGDNPGQWVMNLDKVACEALGLKKACEANPWSAETMRRLYFDPKDTKEASLDTILWDRILLLNADPDYGIERRPACASKEKLARADLVQDDCAVVICKSFTGEAKPKSPLEKLKLLVRKDASEFLKTQKQADPAIFALNRDLDAGTDNLTAKIAIGLPTTLYEDAQSRRELTGIFYGALDRIEQSNKPDVTNISAGARLTLTKFPSVGEVDWGYRIDANANFLSDEEADSLILNGDIAFHPWPPFRLFTSGADAGPIRARASMKALAEFGEVFDAGAKPELIGTNNYFRAGGEVGLSLRSNPNSDAAKALNNFRLNARYKYLHGFDGPVENFSQFEVSLQYQFPEFPNAGLELKYFDGRIDTSLEKSEFLLGGLTLKF